MDSGNQASQHDELRLQDNLDVCTYSLKTGIKPVETTVQDIQPTQETVEDTTPAEPDHLNTSSTACQTSNIIRAYFVSRLQRTIEHYPY